MLAIGNARSLKFAVAAVLLWATGNWRATAITLDFSNLVGTEVAFSNGGFSFTSATNGDQFNITGVTGGAGDSVGFDGYLTATDAFTIGSITTNGVIQTAPVSGSAMLHITDSVGTDLVGSVQWVDITTVGVGGILDLSGTINLTGITYPGASSDLNALASAGAAADSVTFQFVPAESLTQLKNTGGQTSYSGTINAVPEPGALSLVCLAVLGLLPFVRFRK